MGAATRDSMSEYHEPEAELGDDVRDAHRALVSLQEEIEAVDWYQQRLTCCKHPELKRVLEHNRNEEIEHAAMLLEWVRRELPGWDERLRKVLFTSRTLGAAVDAESGGEASTSGSDASGHGLGVGSLRQVTP
jgi:ferritin-like protein